MKRTVLDGSPQYRYLVANGWTVVFRFTTGIAELAVLGND